MYPTVARLDKRKGHDKILMLIKNLKPKFPKIKYISIGFGDEENNLIKLSQELSINEEVVFLNKIDENFSKKILDSEIIVFLMTPKIFRGRYKFFSYNFFDIIYPPNLLHMTLHWPNSL